MCKWKVNRCECPVSYCTEGLEQLGSLEVEYYFSVPEKDAIPILETVCKAVEGGLVIENGAMYRDLFKNVSVFFFKTMSLASDKEVFRLILPDWEGEYPWEISKDEYKKSHFRRQISFDKDMAFYIAIPKIPDLKLPTDFVEYKDCFVIPFMCYFSESASSFCIPPWADKYKVFEYYKRKTNDVCGFENITIFCKPLTSELPFYNSYSEWKKEMEKKLL